MFTLARFHTRFFGGEQCVDIPSGARLVIPGDPHYFGFLAGIHEPHVTEVIRSSVQPGDLCLDVGANIGYFATIMAKVVGPTGRTFAFEPVPDTFEALKLNAFLAENEGLRIEARRAAISNNCGELIIKRSEHSTLNEVQSITEGSANDGDRVQSLTLESFVKSERISQRIALLKVDVEGHELPVIEGAISIIRSGQLKQLILEVTPGDDARQIEAILAPYGTSTEAWINGRWQSTPIGNLAHRTDILVKFA